MWCNMFSQLRLELIMAPTIYMPTQYTCACCVVLKTPNKSQTGGWLAQLHNWILKYRNPMTVSLPTPIEF